MNVDKLMIRTKIFLSVGIVLAMMLVVSVVIFFSVNSLQNTSKWVEHTHKVIANGNQLVAEMVNMETGMRGFLAAGKDEFLEPYDYGQENFKNLMAATQQLVSDNPPQVARLKAIEEQAGQWLAMAAEPQIELRRQINRGFATVQSFKEIQSRILGKEIFDNLRAALNGVNEKFRSEGKQAGQQLIQKITLDLVNMETGQRGFLLTGKQESLEPFNSGREAFSSDLNSLRTYIRKFSDTSVTPADVDSIAGLANDWLEKAANPEIDARNEVNQIPATLDDLVAVLSKAEGKKYMDQIRADIAEFINIERELMVTRQQAAANSSFVSKAVVIVGTLIAFVIGVIAVMIISRKISEPLAQLVEILELMAKGVVDRTVDIKTGDEIADLGRSFNQMVANLKSQVELTGTIANGDLSKDVTLASENDLLGLALQKMTQNLNQTIIDLQTTTNQVTAGAEQLQASAQSLASGTAEQAASLEQVNSSMAEVESQTKNSNENAKQAQQLSTQSIETVNRGNSQMETMLNSMQEISDTSNKVSKVIKVIDEIAFQTNLLALNAAVEAARAGKYGKGFAVVAEEVRNLAGRSAAAAKDTTELIETSLNEVENGVKNAENTAVVLRDISENVNKVNDLVEEISAGANQQTIRIGEINTSLVQVNDVVQQNSSISEETASASDELSSQANEIRNAMNQFKVKGKGQYVQSMIESDYVEPAEPAPELPYSDDGALAPASDTKQIVLDDKEFGRF